MPQLPQLNCQKMGASKIKVEKHRKNRIFLLNHWCNSKSFS
nr:MAG TPA: hypothetical protein [Caudoviricetes sp.]